MLRFFIPLFLFIGCLCCLNRMFHKQNHSFSVRSILTDWRNLPTYSTPLIPSVLGILEQPFTYLDKGNEYYVFLSANKRYVIKFPRLPRHQNLAHTLDTLYTCATALSEETAVLYAHLENTHSQKTMTLIDRLNRKHTIPIDRTPFILQRAGQLYFNQLAEEKDPKPLIQGAVAVYRSLRQKGYADRDPIFQKNFGVSEGKPFIMDVGKITIASEEDTLEKMTVSLFDELSQHYSHLLPLYKKELH